MTATPYFEDFQALAKQQFEAVAGASIAWSKGLQVIAAESTDYSKKTFASGSQVLERLLGARSIEAALQIQSDYARQAYEDFTTQATRVSELCAKVASDTLKPVTSA